MAHWLFKTEPSEFSIGDLYKSPGHTARWDGIRNYQARNLLRDEIEQDDLVWLYHSQCRAVGLVGMAKIITPAYPDPSQWDPESHYYDAKSSMDNPRWYCVDLCHQTTFEKPILLADLKKIAELQDMTLFKQGRLSVQPISAHHIKILHRLIS